MMDKDIFKLLLFIENLLGYKKNEKKIVKDNRFECFSETEMEKYFTIIDIIQKSAPEIMYDTNCFLIKSYSKKLCLIHLEEKIIVLLFLNKIFNEEDAVSLEEIKELLKDLHDYQDIKNIKSEIEKNDRIKSTKNKKYYINRLGCFKAQGILSSIMKIE